MGPLDRHTAEAGLGISIPGQPTRANAPLRPSLSGMTALHTHSCR
jgi:hypothetical protein